MHLTSLTLRGFKSFAAATTLRLEPGITAVVGPNGSGKSNVVDAIAWVLGEQGAKSLRGGRMEDVIFAGTPGRPALGRAEVTLTIDNSDGALPIDYAEVTVSRLMFRSGESEYAINGAPCRLLDVQELLSDSGIGRELHVVVGQGQLDAVLVARPEERRAFIEEAAGVAKHRRRKDKALRKLDAMAANLSRLTDLTTELRRQLAPLGRQAEVARRAGAIQAELRDARLRLAADELSGLRADLASAEVELEAANQRRLATEQSLATTEARERELESVLSAGAERLAATQETYYRLAALRERFRGTADLAAVRHRHLASDSDLAPGDSGSPEALAAELGHLRGQLAASQDALHGDGERLAAAAARRARLEERLRAEEAALLTMARAQADRREGMATLLGRVASMRARTSAAGEEIARLAAARAAATERARAAQQAVDSLQAGLAELQQTEQALDAAYEKAAAALAGSADAVEQLVAQERTAEREKSFWTARREALELSLRRRDGAGALLAADRRLPGVVGAVAELLSVEAGWERAIGAALGALADAVAVDSPEAALAALETLKRGESGRATLLVGSGLPGRDSAGDPPAPALPAGARWATELVVAPEGLRAAVRRLLGGVVVVADLPAARRLLAALPEATVVTLEGDVLGQWQAVGGSASAPSALEVHAAAEEAAQRAAEATRRAEQLRFGLAAARRERDARQEELQAALESLHASDARVAAVADQLAVAASRQRGATEEAERLGAAAEQATSARDGDLAGLAELEHRVQQAQSAPTHGEPDPTARDAATALLEAARAEEVDARLAVTAGEERSRALASRVAELDHTQAERAAATARRSAARQRRAAAGAVAAAVLEATHRALSRLEHSLAAASAQQAAVELSRRSDQAEHAAVRSRRRELAAEGDALSEAAHRHEVERTQHQLRVTALEARCAEDYGVDPETVLADYGPDRLVPPPAAAGDEATAAPFDREAVRRRAAAAERQLALLGRVNPLALEEYSALEERHAFLCAQVEDLRASRRDLLTVVRDVDERIREVFAAAFHDTAREFGAVFAQLFGGGEGRLVLTDPADLLNTGVELEARPPGKQVKRLSLLSGGERALSAIALLLAIFRARPSPFYVLDEIEAALDDRNLNRLLAALEDFRETSQLIVVTHQKRTMEIADALYGVAMRDGLTTIISQRLREREEIRA